MTASFFAQQEAARRSTVVLLLYFVLAVLFILLLVDVLFGLAFWRFQPPDLPALFWHGWTERAMLVPLFLISLGGVIGFFQMRTGGHAVAAMVGATPVPFTAMDLTQRRLINIVEEMSIAAGIRVPALYVMEREDGINAFVAGLEVDDAVLVLTRGALDFLERDELQGVVGHEFSHILNGDMRLNMRLIAVLTGLLIMGQTGSYMVRLSQFREGSVLTTAALLSVGLVLWPIGYAGLVAGRLIKAAISRQRETLADACSVQFTRNPDGLAGALLKIRNQSEGSLLRGFHAESMSHMCFGPALNLARWYATHPPIDERIETISPHFLARRRARRRRDDAWSSAVLPQQGRVDALEKPWQDLAPIEYSTAAIVSTRIGTVTPAHVDAAASLRQQLPARVQTALQSREGAQALLYALIASQQAVGTRDVQAFFADRDGPVFADQVLQLRDSLAGLRVGLPIVDMAVPRLVLLDEAATRRLLGGLQAFSQLDRRLSVFEFALQTLVRQQLLPGRLPRGQASLVSLAEPFSVVVAALLYHGSDAAAPPLRLADAHAAAFEGLGEVPPLPARQAAGLPQMGVALRKLATLEASGKRLFMERCAQVVQGDGVFSAAEYELLRVIGALVGCPLPLGLFRR